MRILYFCPDFPQPSGGIKTLYRHVNRLCARGFDAYIVHQKRDFRASWHVYDAPVLWLSDRPTFSPDDVLVIPEVMHSLMQQTARFAGRRIVIALSWSPTYWGLKPGQSWTDFGIREVMVKSPLIQRYVKWNMGLEAMLIPEFINPALYYVPDQPKEKRICYLPRKERSGAWLHGIFQRSEDRKGLVAWQPLQNLDEAEYAEQLRRARFFLVTNLQEGMNSSVLEAMACGCLVMGYAGVGGNSYMVGSGPEQNAFLVPNGDLPALGPAVQATFERVREQPDAFDEIIRRGVQTAARFQNEKAESQALGAFLGRS